MTGSLENFGYCPQFEKWGFKKAFLKGYEQMKPIVLLCSAAPALMALVAVAFSITWGFHLTSWLLLIGAGLAMPAAVLGGVCTGALANSNCLLCKCGNVIAHNDLGVNYCSKCGVELVNCPK